MYNKIGVVVVDDSLLMRQMVAKSLSSCPNISVLGCAADPLQARSMIKALNPDVLTLDVEMPHMDGLAFLQKVMSLRPMPVIMVSSLTTRGADATLRALDIGAIDFVPKPTGKGVENLRRFQLDLVKKVIAAAGSTVKGAIANSIVSRAPQAISGFRSRIEKLVAVGASTGGVAAIRSILASLEPDGLAIVITQHMPAEFTERFALRLNEVSSFEVHHAAHGQLVVPGHAYVAPGGKHLLIVNRDGRYHCELNDGEIISGHRPSVDVLLSSVAEAAGPDAIGVILTGMGRDGAQGLKRMRQAGAFTIGQDRDSCVVYGMSRAARDLGAVSSEVALDKIALELRRISASGISYN